MSDIDPYAEPEEYMDELESDCPYGFEFCEEPETRALGICTTDCDTYLAAVEEEAQQ